MVTMSGVWDRTTQVIAARAAVLVPIVLLFVWLPSLLQSTLRLSVPGLAAPAGVGAVQAGLGLVGLAVAVLGSIGHLTMVAAAGDRALARDAALRLALARFLPYLGLVVVLLIALLLLAAPIGIAAASAYPSLEAMRAGQAPRLTTGVALFATLYGLAALVVALWLEARVLSVLAPVVVHERLGIGALARAFRLTRGLTWRIIGVLVLFAITAGVVVIAAQSTLGVALRLLLGDGGRAAALFLTAAAVSLIGCGIGVVVAVFTTQLYEATAGGAGAGRRPAP